MKIKSIRKVCPELYRVIYQTFFLKREIERYAIIDHFTIESEDYAQVTWRDADKLAEVRPQIEWMIRHNVDFFDNDPGNGVSLMIDNRKKTESEEPAETHEQETSHMKTNPQFEKLRIFVNSR